MAFLKNVLVLSLLAVLASATVLVKRGSVLTGQYDIEQEDGGRYTLENNQWGKAQASSGSQNAQVTAVNDHNVTWHTTYTWKGAQTSVKTYTNIKLHTGIGGKTLAQVQSIPTYWSWTYTSASSDLIADVSYDLWLSRTANTAEATTSSTYEIMIWLSRRGSCQPVGSQITSVTINGVTWALWKGTVANWTVFSFVPPSEITTFSQDLKPYFNYLTQSQGIPSSQYLVHAQSGTEPFTGSATLTTNAYSISVN